MPGMLGEAVQKVTKANKATKNVSEQVGVATEVNAQGALKATDINEEENK
ncbi:hypothetical protein GCM10009123_05270 [Kangiella japonica]|uniref:CsbD family protein n=1 Tax=Kangiella japonica TaxID=647384 RepID=A0ABN0SUH4_9GAMM